MAKAQEKGLIFFPFFLLLLSLLCVMQNEGRDRIKEGELNYNKQSLSCVSACVFCILDSNNCTKDF